MNKVALINHAITQSLCLHLSGGRKGYQWHSVKVKQCYRDRLQPQFPVFLNTGQRRWRSTKTVVEHIEAGRQFEDSALHVLFAKDG